MSLERATLAAAIARQGRLARVVVAGVQGSAPREVGAAMLVWPAGQSGTIGGGALELQAAERARQALANARDRLDRVPLGPGLGQCCGGAVTLLTEIWDRDRLDRLTDRDSYLRPLPAAQAIGASGDAAPPLAVRRWQAALRQGQGAAPAMLQGWMVEPLGPPARDLWVWGAGHVGRAVVPLMAGLPGWRITWADTAPERFPEPPPEAVRILPAADLPAAVALAPPGALHLILTYSHEIDLALCHALLRHGFGWCGLIGSTSKWARFRNRLRQLGHSDAAISGICCPIGRKSFGKHPQAIAVGVAADLLSLRGTEAVAKDAAG